MENIRSPFQLIFRVLLAPLMHLLKRVLLCFCFPAFVHSVALGAQYFEFRMYYKFVSVLLIREFVKPRLSFTYPQIYYEL